MAVDWDNLLIGPTVARFGEAVVYTSRRLSAAFPIVGVFDEAYKELRPLAAGEVTFSDVALGSLISTDTPLLGVQLSQFPPLAPPTQGDMLLVRGLTFAVKEVRPDSHGWAKLLLNQMEWP